MAKTTDPMTAALLRERDGYLAQGKTDRAAQVDEQLRLRGYELPAKEPGVDDKPPIDASTTGPRGRGGRPKTTA